MTRASSPGGALSLSWCLVVLLMMGSARMAAAQDDAAALHFDLQAQPLDAALAAFGHRTGHSVLVASSLTEGRQAAAVQGRYAPREALQRLLAGTGLVARYSGERAFTLVPAPEAPAARGDAPARNEPQAAATQTRQAYAAVLQRSITRVLCLAQPDAFGRYRLALQLWIDPAGLVEEARLLEPTGVPARDAAVLALLRAMAMDAPPPAGLPQPLTLLLTPRPDPARDCRPYRARAG